MASVPEVYLIVNPVWGDAYLERFLKLSLPAQLCAGNVQALPAARSRYLIYTHERHFAAIRESDSFRRLEQLIPASLLSLDDLPDPRTNPNPHELQTAAYNRGLRFGRGKSTAFVFLTPDILLADGSFARLVELCERQGKRVVTIASIRMCVEGTIECLDDHRTGTPGELAIPARDLVRHCLNDIHPISAAHIVTARGVRAAQHHYWPVGTDAFLIHAFHLSPMLVWPTEPNVTIRGTLDDDFVGRACPDRSAWYTATDTDEICQVEFSTREHKNHIFSEHYFSDACLQQFMYLSTNEAHRAMFRTPFRFHASDVDPAAWAPVEARAAEYAAKLLAKFEGAHGRPGPEEAAPISIAVPGKSTLSRVFAPLRYGYRKLAAPLYGYLDRMNAEMIGLRAEIDLLRVEQQHLREKLGGSERRAA